MTKNRASGAFEVRLSPQEFVEGVGDSGIGRLALDKRYHGDLVGTSKGQMLASRSPVQGSAGYVAIERVEAKLAGRTGSFVLQHSGHMERGVSSLSINVVADSGDQELSGIQGTMTIKIDSGNHSYVFDYELPPTH